MMLTMTERTLILIKPDGVSRGLVGEVISRIERKGLKLVALDLRVADEATAKEHYAEHVDKPFFGELVDFITSAPLVAGVIEGPNAIAAWRQLAGGTNPVEAAVTSHLRLLTTLFTVPILRSPLSARLVFGSRTSKR